MLQHLPQVLLFESNFFHGAHWMEERQAEEKGKNNTQKQAEHLEELKPLHMIGTNGADWKTAHQGCALQTFDSKGARQAGFDMASDNRMTIELHNRTIRSMLTSDSNVEDKALWQPLGLVVYTDLHKGYRSDIKGLRRKMTILCQ
ncbi:hypothetical protein PoB_003540800 [Plakobranchus ocellatus]|uniref:Transposase n=1 Tax=Plakobranchus ocellatus TaxID=259542 RepID=A0AAV4ANI6_9GAST|nr:hypothetical protein PoB_003540800 [Plakobranchus ocellatus]